MINRTINIYHISRFLSTLCYSKMTKKTFKFIQGQITQIFVRVLNVSFDRVLKVKLLLIKTALRILHKSVNNFKSITRLAPKQAVSLRKCTDHRCILHQDVSSQVYHPSVALPRYSLKQAYVTFSCILRSNLHLNKQYFKF